MTNDRVGKRGASKSHCESGAKKDLASEDVRAEAVRKGRASSRILPLVKVITDGKEQKVMPAHDDPLVGAALLYEATGASDRMFSEGILYQLARSASENGKVDEGRLNFMLSALRSTKPKDQLEAMLAAQMAVVHLAVMRMAPIFANTNEIPQLDSVGRALNNLARTFATQMEALKRYRTGGEQKVTVQHVSVSDGGQAIVGNVTQRARGNAAEASSNLPSPPLARPSQALNTAPIDFKRRSAPVRRRPT